MKMGATTPQAPQAADSSATIPSQNPARMAAGLLD
jgi:hypothetical protein